MRIFILAFLSVVCALNAAAQPADSLNLMPRPQSVRAQNGVFVFTKNFTIAIKGPASIKLAAAANRFYQQLGKSTGIIFSQDYITAADSNSGAQLTIRYDKTVSPAIGVDESYRLSVSTLKITLKAATDIGALRGLETLYQLVMIKSSGFYSPAVEIADHPRFKWRGIMIDVARHFIPMEVIKRNVDAMAIVKMNVLHLHLSDDEGFRVESKVYPGLQAAGSNGLYYTQQQLKELVSYAHDRGIIVVPEFDLPGHCTSILAAYPFLATYPANYKPARRFNLDTIKKLSLATVMKVINEAATPTIDPSKESSYTFFDNLFKEMSAIFPDAYLHVGADENNGTAWKQNPAIVAFMNAKGFKTTDDLQAYFVQRMYGIAKKYNKRLIGWEETFNPSIPADEIVQKWKPSADTTFEKNVIAHHNQLIISSGFYLDLFMPAYIHYLNDPVAANISQADADKGVLGAEAAIWSELVDGDNEELRVWPRAAAIAERMWSAASLSNVDDMYRRLWATNRELNIRGLAEDADYRKIISRWVDCDDLQPVMTLTDVYAPVKGYKRLMSGMFTPATDHPNLASPLVKIADVVHCDSEPRKNFRKLVALYLTIGDSNCLKKIKTQLLEWRNNKKKFDALAAKSPYLQSITVLSDQLLSAASIGLLALEDKTEKGGLLKLLEQMEPAAEQVQLSILPEIEALVTGKLKQEPASYSLF